MSVVSFEKVRNFEHINLSLLRYEKIFKTTYIDQNILSLMVSNIHLIEYNRFAGLDTQFIFSNETLNEIARSNQPEKFLDVLTLLKARHLIIETDSEYGFSDTAHIKPFIPLNVLYDQYVCTDIIDRYAKRIIDSNYDFFLSIMSDSERESSLKQIHDEQRESFLHILNELDHNLFFLLDSDEIPEDLKEFIKLSSSHSTKGFEEQFDSSLISIEKSLAEQGCDVNRNIGLGGIKEYEKLLGFGAKQLNNIQLPNVIEKIYQLYCNEPSETDKVTIDEFVNFNQDTELRELTLNKQIMNLYIFLNIIGYQRDTGFHDKKRRLISMISDANHAVYGSYADFVASNDQRFLAKCNAIYEYLNIKARGMKILVNSQL